MLVVMILLSNWRLSSRSACLYLAIDLGYLRNNSPGFETDEGRKMSSEIPSDSPAKDQPTKRRIRWFPIIWVSLLTAIVVQSRYYFEDPGIYNSITHFAVILGVVGIALWVLVRSRWQLTTRFAAAGVLLLAISAHYLQFSPIEFVNNGDVGLVDWRWRWVDPDRQLTTVAAENEQQIDWQPTEWDYPRFLGNGYWAEAEGVTLNTNWKANPPEVIWEQRIGAGWSAFAVVGHYAVTQEQRGEQEMVTCYDIEDGSLVWSHADDVRFDPSGGGSLGGVGPQATPTIHEGRVYTHGATGVINCMEATSGTLLWSHDAVTEFEVETLLWGKSASPLIVDHMVVVSIGDARASISEAIVQEGNSLVAFDQLTGEVIWKAGNRRSSYASPILTTLAGVRQIVVVNEDYITSHRADDGTILWEHPWPGRSDTNASASQPVPVGKDRIFVSKGYGIGSELIQISRADDRWDVETVWKKNVMKTKMCNVVVHEGYIYGIDDVHLACVELESGKKQWKKRRRPTFGHGQIMLVGEQLLVISEEGEVILAAANPDEYSELGSFQAIDGITWNNLALAGPNLLVRNAEWAACFELPLANPNSSEASDPNKDSLEGTAQQ